MMFKRIGYECHITIAAEPISDKAIEDFLEGSEWHFSKIDGDPELGKGVKRYATAFYGAKDHDEDDAFRKMDKMEYALERLGCAVVRCKIESIIYDKKKAPSVTTQG